MTTKTPETDETEIRAIAAGLQRTLSAVETDRDQLRARVSELEAENARLRLAAIEDAKDHDRRVTECERWADRVAEMERERDEARNAHRMQAENYARLHDAVMGVGVGTCDFPDPITFARSIHAQRDATTEALKRARVAIEEAPHPSSCDGWRAVSGRTLIFRAKRCDCWKVAALHDLAAAETDK